MLNLTDAELRALKHWLTVIQFTGTRAELRAVIELYDRVCAEVEAALEETESGTDRRRVR